MLFLGVVFALFVQIMQQAVYQRVGRAALVLVHHQPNGLVRKKYVLVLVYHVQLSGRGEKAFAVLGIGEKLVVYVHLYNVALAKLLRDLYALSVAFYALLAYVFVHRAFRQSRADFRDEFIRALSRVVFLYGKFFHACLSFLVWRFLPRLSVSS